MFNTKSKRLNNINIYTKISYKKILLKHNKHQTNKKCLEKTDNI